MERAFRSLCRKRKLSVGDLLAHGAGVKCDTMAGFIARARSELKMKGKWTAGKAWTVESNRVGLHIQGLLCNLPSGRQ